MEKFPAAEEGAPPRLGRDLPPADFKARLTERVKSYSQRVYKRVTAKPATETRTAGICQRENGFYIDTVRAFRDRRYEYKGLVKRWKGALAAAQAQVRLHASRGCALLATLAALAVMCRAGPGLNALQYGRCTLRTCRIMYTRAAIQSI